MSQSPEGAEHMPHPAMYDMTIEDFVAMVRFHGANEVIDAVLAVAVEIYGDVPTAVEKCHRTFLLRAEALSTPSGVTS